MELSASKRHTVRPHHGRSKLRLTGGKRAFGRWADVYARIARLKYDPPAFEFSGALSSRERRGTLAMYYYAVKTQVGVPGTWPSPWPTAWSAARSSPVRHRQHHSGHQADARYGLRL